jgi:sugar lactone lactonase YvrE
MSFFPLPRKPNRNPGKRNRSFVPRLESLEDRACPSGFTVVATGLDSPRGFAFGSDGQMYLAQAGPSTNTLSTTGDPTVQQVPPPVGPYTGGFNSSIVRINLSTGAVAPVVTGLPSSQTTKATGSLVSGVADVVFLGGALYGIEAGAGPSHGIVADPTQPAPVLTGMANTLFRVNPDGTTTIIANLSAYLKAHPVANPDPADFEPDGTWYSMVAVRGALYAADPNHQEIDRITPDGQITRVVDMSGQLNPAQGNWAGPTALGYHGNFYAGTLGEFGPTHKPESVYQITPSGQFQAVVTGLSEVLGVDFDSQGRMYVLESSTGGVAPIPGTGVVARVNDDGSLTTLADGLTFPTAMRFGPDGNLYVSNFGFAIPHAGQIVRIDLGPVGRDTTLAGLAGLAAGSAPAHAAPDTEAPAEHRATTPIASAGPYAATVVLAGLAAEPAPTAAPTLAAAHTVTPIGNRGTPPDAPATLPTASVSSTDPAPAVATPQGDKGDALLALFGDDLNLD